VLLVLTQTCATILLGKKHPIRQHLNDQQKVSGFEKNQDTLDPDNQAPEYFSSLYSSETLPVKISSVIFHG
jgi:hypothetical protein